MSPFRVTSQLWKDTDEAYGAMNLMKSVNVIKDSWTQELTDVKVETVM